MCHIHNPELKLVEIPQSKGAGRDLERPKSSDGRKVASDSKKNKMGLMPREQQIKALKELSASSHSLISGPLPEPTVDVFEPQDELVRRKRGRP